MTERRLSGIGLPTPTVTRRPEAADTMEAWERFLTGDPSAAIPARNFVVASWLRSQQLGIDPAGRSAPLAARGEGMERLRRRHADLISASAKVFADVADIFSGSRSIMLLTNGDGVVLDAVGDRQTLGQGENIHLTRGGSWSEDAIGTNGIGTALATGRPAQVHAAEHFCEGIKAWTCAAAPIFEPGTGAMLGVVDISGPPSTYQRNNLSLAVSTARQIEMVLAERAANERMRLLEVCLDRISEADVAGMVAIDRAGRLVHRTGRVPSLVELGQRVPGLDGSSAVEDWADRLPEGLRAEWFSPVTVDGRAIGAVLVVPVRTRPAAPGHQGAFDLILGQSAAMAEALGRARQLVGKQVPVLIEGETGVGKELFARAIHAAHDPRRPFVVLNCGAVAKDLLAAELFGHVRGAFTGAASEGRAGRFELAHGGTLCLDEIGELPLDLQPFLLRVLEEGVVYRLGDGQPRRVEVRLLALTNRNLLEEVAAGRFRRDVYHRISVTRLRPPPLREREGDVELLVAHFNAALAERHEVPRRRFGPEVLRLLAAYHWPGNVRELRNVVESLLLMSDAPEVRLDELAAGLSSEPVGTAPAAFEPPGDRDAAASLEATERAAIVAAVRLCHGNLTAAAKSLGVSRSTLYRKVERYRLQV
jgi:transcriptional regulator of acetoin/glycerol metabolism